MPLDRDDADERIARLEKLMREAHAKPSAGADAKAAEAKGQGGSTPAKVADPRAPAKKRRRKI
jgi:hypothetical protein